MTAKQGRPTIQSPLKSVYKGSGPNCAAPLCPRPVRSDGLCGSHLTIRDLGLPLEAETVWIAKRLVNFVVDANGCHIWQGQPNNKGYGIVSAGKDRTWEAAHRWFYKRLVGPIPEGLVLDHLCRVTMCVNVAHLEPVTRLENDRRGQIARGFGVSRATCANGHPWVSENLRGFHSAMWGQRYTCRRCNTENARKNRGYQPRVSAGVQS